MRGCSSTVSENWPKYFLNAAEHSDAEDDLQERPHMDLQAHTVIGSASSRWAKMLALFCFAVACALLIGSLSTGHKAGTAAAPIAAVISHPLV